MRIPRKIVIPALAVLAGASLAGSITSTMAWYQYAVQARVAYTGTTSHCSKLLRISADGGTTWGNDIGSDAFGAENIHFAPITTGAQLKNAALQTRTVIQNAEEVTIPKFYAQPNIKQGPYNRWYYAGSEYFAQFNILIKVNDVNTASPQLANKVFLTDVTIQDASTNGSLDLSKAMRVHLATNQGKYYLFSKDGATTNVGGYLDLNNDGEYDTAGYEWGNEQVFYGGGTPANPDQQTSYAMNDANIIAVEDQYGQITSDDSLSIGTTSASNDHLQVTVTIWLEGWALLQYGEAGNIASSNSQVWDSSKYTNKKFNVGLTFGVKLHTSDE